MSQDLITLLTLLLGGSGGGIVIVRAILDYRSNVAAREKEFNKSVIESLKDTRTKLDTVEDALRDWKEYASELIGFMLRQGISRGDIPKPPDEREE